jgi:methylenetetrahydrofolate reductase (NADPH)
LTSPQFLVPALSGVVLFGVHVLIERSRQEPIFPVALYRRGCFAAAIVSAIGGNFAWAVVQLQTSNFWQLVQHFNGGQDPVQGELPDGPTDLFAGAAADPQSASWSGLKSRLLRKKQAGARFIQTQMVMDAEALKRFVGDLAAPLDLPVLAGVFLLKSARNAAFINRVVPGANIPQAVIDRLAAAPDPAAEGVAIAAEQVGAYLQIAQGVHLMAIKAEERIPAILQQAGLKPLALG